MKHRLIPLLIGLLISAMARGQAVPRVTKEGKQAFEMLLVACANDGALKVVKKPDGVEIPVADEAKLKLTVAANRKLLTPAMRDIVVANWFKIDADQKAVHVAILRAYAAEKDDERALAFAALFTATAERERKLSAAIPQYQEAVKHFGAVGDAPWQAVCLNDIGLTYHYLADHPKAWDAFQQALVQWRKVHDGPHAGTANSLGNLGLAYRDFGDYVNALKYHQEALAMRRKLDNPSRIDIALSLNNIGEDYYSSGDYALALKQYHQALALLPKAQDRPHPDVPLTLDNIGAAHAGLGDTAQALESFRKALAMRRKLHKGIHRDLAQSLHNLGTAYHDADDPTQALDYLQQALTMKSKLYEGPHSDTILTLNNIGSAYSALKDDRQALEYYDRALAMGRKLHDAPFPDIAATLTNLASIHRDQGEPRKALKTLDDALKELRLSPKSEPLDLDQPGRLRPLPLTVQVLRNRGQTLEDALPEKPSAKQLRECQRCYTLAADLLDRVRQESLIHEASKIRAGAREASLTRRQISICRRLHEQEGNGKDLIAAFHAVEQSRARVFLEALSQARAGQLGGISPELRSREAKLLIGLRAHDLRIERAEAQRGQTDIPLAKLWEERNRLAADLQQLTAEMEKQSPRYAALKRPRPCTLEAARAALADNEVAVLFVVDDKTSFVVIVHKKAATDDKTGGVALIELPGGDVLGPKVRTLVATEVLRSDSRTRQLGGELHDLLLKPLAKHIEGKDLLIAPDGVLWELPFELLVQGKSEESDGQYLIQKRQVRYTLSMTVLHLIEQWEQKRQAPKEPLWALGDPIFSKDDERAKGDLHQETKTLLERYALRSGAASYARLPATGREVQALADLHGVGKDDVVTDARACEKVLKTASDRGILARKRYIHLATHGILGSARGRQPSLVLSLVDNDGKEDGGGVNDGFLTMEEVTHLKLNADLVVLSACETGKGDLQASEGVIGLTRAFLYAGSRGVMCSLWYVEDEQTSRLMQAMYAELKKNKSAAEALALARRKLIEEEQSPLCWAPFILIGK